MSCGEGRHTPATYLMDSVLAVVDLCEQDLATARTY